MGLGPWVALLRAVRMRAPCSAADGRVLRSGVESRAAKHRPPGGTTARCMPGGGCCRTCSQQAATRPAVGCCIQCGSAAWSVACRQGAAERRSCGALRVPTPATAAQGDRPLTWCAPLGNSCRLRPVTCHMRRRTKETKQAEGAHRKGCCEARQQGSNHRTGCMSLRAMVTSKGKMNDVRVATKRKHGGATWKDPNPSSPEEW